MIAYDYRRQCWVEDPAQAHALLLEQARQTYELLAGPKGEEYARLTGQSRREALRTAEAKLAEIANRLPT